MSPPNQSIQLSDLKRDAGKQAAREPPVRIYMMTSSRKLEDNFKGNSHAARQILWGRGEWSGLHAVRRPLCA